MESAVNGKSFLQGVRRANVGTGELALWYIGGAGYIARTSTATLLIDPFIGPSNPPDWIRAIPPAFDSADLDVLGPIDAVLLSHEHGDHADPVALAAIASRTVAPVIGPLSCIDAASTAGVPADRTVVLPHDSARSFGDLSVTAVAMHDPAAQNANGYLIQIDTVTMLHCGDSVYFSGFQELGKRWDIDAICLSVGLNPPGRQFYLDESGAARATRDSGARTLIVQHHDLWQGITIDPGRVRAVCRWYAPDVRVISARLQRRITLSRRS